MGPSLSTPETSLLSTLSTPLKIGPLTLRNKFMMSSLTRDRCYPTNVPTELMVEYYRQRAKGGVGLIVSEGMLIERQGTEWPHAPGIWSDEHIHAWKKITEAVHQEGAHMYAQLWHVGRVRHSDAPEQIASGEPVYAPSPIAAKFGKFRFLPGEPPCSTPLEIQDPMNFVDLYRQAAINAKKAGFDGVEINASNGYLIHTFLDHTSNHRTDEYGGSIRNRSRFGLEVLEVVSEVFGANRVGVKLSPCSGRNDMGMSLKDTLDTYTYFITEADKLELAYMVLIRHIPLLSAIIDGKERGTPHDVISSYKHLFKNSLFFLNGDYSPIEAADVIASGRAHGVFFGRPFISNPDLPKRVEKHIPLNMNVDMLTLYGPKDGIIVDVEALSKGYTDYSEAVVAEEGDDD
ncbi:FMN-linked oxidoreductase [Dendrothele bispora CBS 962.96]|uniref:FMN-linked oxidoreductase n=1 Tax=Dendrothele bispora (strain CBS 962.96) TaxID=1314807 RepID=A0A4S8MA29_DENBC|nr:FMN-linked oxidoreductase [Dendrothele bispora CBS 962.96]